MHEGEDGQKSTKQLPFLKNIEASTSSYNQSPSNNANDVSSQPSSNLKPSSKNTASQPKTMAGILESSLSFYEEVRQVPGNRACADCGNQDAKWASINLGVVVCIECSGAHRSLGVHISKVRSLTMDDLTDNQKGGMIRRRK